MNVETLSVQLRRPEVLEAIRSTFRSAISVGIGHDAHGELALVVRVTENPTQSSPRKFEINGEQIPLVIKGGARVPEPLSQPSHAPTVLQVV